MARRLSSEFFSWLQNSGYSILSTITQYKCLSIALNGSSLRIYFQGCKVLEIIFDYRTENYHFKPISVQYIKSGDESELEDIIDSGIESSNLQKYLDLTIGLISRRDNRRQEDRIRQEIAYINNSGRDANDTDFFIVDQEYGVTVGSKTSKFDLVAIKWPSEGEIRKNFIKSNIEIVIFELKLGKGAIGGTVNAQDVKADLKNHINDYVNFINDSDKLENFKKDILYMFVQQACLNGFFNSKITGLKHVKKLFDNDHAIEELAEKVPVKFGFIIADYKQKSVCLADQLNMFNDDFLFATSSFMGYGLFDKCIINRDQLIDKSL